MPTALVQSVPAAAWVADPMKFVVECPSSRAFQTTVALPRRVIATCGSSPSGS